MNKTTLLIAALALGGIFAACTKQKQISLFNGKDLSNWNFVVSGDTVPPAQVFTVHDGTIRIKGEPIGYMYTKEKYADCTLELEWRWPEEASNSGIFLLIADPANPFPNAIECQLKAGQAGDFVMLGGSRLNEYELPEGASERPKFPMMQKLQPSNEKPVGEWNKATIGIADGTIEVYINGVLQNRGTNPVKEGHIGLQSEGKEVQFRNITITQE